MMRGKTCRAAKHREHAAFLETHPRNTENARIFALRQAILFFKKHRSLRLKNS
jgi:hypothetical protein